MTEPRETTDPVIDVVFVAFPDGTSIWLRKNKEYLDKCVQAWKAGLDLEKRKRLQAAKVSMVTGQLIMLESDYNSITTTNSFPWPDQ